MIPLVISSFLLCQVMGEPIVDGYTGEIKEQPWLASIQANNHHFCGGSIVSERTILTTAHCAKKYRMRSLSVQVASSKDGEGGSRHRVVQIKTHENYNPSSIPTANDVALLKVSPPFKLDEDVKIANLARKGNTVQADTVASVAVYGRPSKGEKGLLNEWSVRIVDNNKCSVDYGKNFLFWFTNSYMHLLSNGFICAVAPGVGHCKGDSGNPLVVAGVQVGITIWSTDCAGSDSPGVYANVAVYRDWIDRNVKIFAKACSLKLNW